MTPRRPVPPPPRSASDLPSRAPLRWVEARAQVISRRTAFICGGAALVYAALFGRLLWLQVLVRDRFAQQTTVSSERTQDLKSPRGLILDRDHCLLVRNAPGFTVVVDPNAWFQDNAPTLEDSPRARRARALEGLGKLYPDQNLESRLPRETEMDPESAPPPPGDRRLNRRFKTLDVERYVTPDRAEAIRRLALPGIGLHPATKRVALDGTHAAHVVGFVSQYGNGRRGMEEEWDKVLAGTPGVMTYRADFRGVVPGTERITRPGVPGQDLVLTIDSVLQHDVERELARTVQERHAESGAAVVLDARNGDILALASVPVYNVNNPSASVENDRNNLTCQMVYEPGSTFKTITLAGALEAGIAAPESVFHCSGEIKIGKRRVRCAPHGQFQHGHGAQSLIGVLTHSCNVATAGIADRLGPERLKTILSEFGFGRSTGSGLPREEAGLIPSRWSRIRVANVGFGQGIAVTPIQLAAAYGVFVDGQYHTPRIVRARRDPTTGVETEMPVPAPQRVLSDRTAAEVRRMLQSVVEHGTGVKAGLDRYVVGGKTGTAQISEKGAYGSRYFASFVGLAPIRDPRFVILVAIKAPQGDHYGGSVAGPVFRFIAERALTLADVAPERDAPPKKSARAAVEE